MTQSPIPRFTISQGVLSDASTSWKYDWATIITTSLVAIWTIQQLLKWLDYPLLSLPELLWNSLVHLTPSSLVFWLQSLVAPSSNAVSPRKTFPPGHAEKSQAMREIFRIGSGNESHMGRTTNSPTAPKGLGNWDNSCYQNSVLQALASLPSMQKFFASVSETLEGLPDSSTIQALQHLADQLNDTTSNSSYHWTPAKLKSMSSWQQQDAQEYFSKLVDAMDTDLSAELKDFTAKDEAAALSLADLLELAHSKEDGGEARRGFEGSSSINVMGSRLARAVEMPFEGLLAQRVGCTECHYSEGLSLIPFNCLTVPIGRAPAYELEDCFNEFTELDYIDGVECAKCSLLAAKQRLEQLSAHLLKQSSEEELSAEYWPILRQKALVQARLHTVNEAIKNEDFSDQTLAEKCQITKALRKTSRKSRQAAIMRQPTCLVVHVNRSIFDEYTGSLLKNHAQVAFPASLDMSPWCVGGQETAGKAWDMDPSQPLVHGQQVPQTAAPAQYELKAVITHHGRHENGHYVCFRQSPPGSGKSDAGGDSSTDMQVAEDTLDLSAKWWRLSDENVSLVDQAQITVQGGAFMLFYEKIPQTAEHCSEALATAATGVTPQNPLPETTAVHAAKPSIKDELPPLKTEFPMSTESESKVQARSMTPPAGVSFTRRARKATQHENDMLAV